MVKCRFLVDIGGTVSRLNPDGSVYNDVDGVRRGQIVHLDDLQAERYLRAGMVTLILEGELPPLFRVGELMEPNLRDQRFAEMRKIR